MAHRNRKALKKSVGEILWPVTRTDYPIQTEDEELAAYRVAIKALQRIVQPVPPMPVFREKKEGGS